MGREHLYSHLLQEKADQPTTQCPAHNQTTNVYVDSVPPESLCGFVSQLNAERSPTDGASPRPGSDSSVHSGRHEYSQICSKRLNYRRRCCFCFTDNTVPSMEER